MASQSRWFHAQMEAEEQSMPWSNFPRLLAVLLLLAAVAATVATTPASADSYMVTVRLDDGTLMTVIADLPVGATLDDAAASPAVPGTPVALELQPPPPQPEPPAAQPDSGPAPPPTGTPKSDKPQPDRPRTQPKPDGSPKGDGGDESDGNRPRPQRLADEGGPAQDAPAAKE